MSYAMTDWAERLDAEIVPWLLEARDAAVRHLALRDLLDLPADDPRIVDSLAEAMRSNPIAAILDAQDAEGWWVKPGAGYLPKYTATTWQLSFLEQMGADPADARVRAACEYVLEHAQARTGAFSVGWKSDAVPPPSNAIHCLNGNVLRALLGFGWLDDERVQRSIAWHAAIVTDDPSVRRYSYTPSAGFSCSANRGEMCAWGATKALLALVRVPVDRRTEAVQRSVDLGVASLLSRDPAVADYPTAVPGAKPNESWFKLGFPSGYITDVLQVLEALVAAGAGDDPRLDRAVEWLLTRRTPEGRWVNEYRYHGKMLVDVDEPRKPSKWVTLRACRVLKGVAEARQGRG